MKKKSAIVKRAGKTIRSLDWVGRLDDAKTIVSTLSSAAMGTWGWVMGNWKWGLFAVGLTLLLIRLFWPVIEDTWKEHRLWKRYEGRKRGDIPKPLAKLAKKAALVAEALQRERLDTKHEDIALFGQNRKALRRLAGDFDDQNLDHPAPNPTQGDMWEWEAFIWDFIMYVEEGKLEKLPTCYQDIRELLEKREYWQDAANVIRHVRKEGNMGASGE